MTIKFLGAARTVTGSKHLIILDDGRQILLDCGLYQGKGDLAYPINRNLNLNPEELSCVILSHIHIDHSGNLPFLVKKGYNGPIYSTAPTRDLSTIMLMDSAHIQEEDTKYYNKRQLKKNLPLFEPLYTSQDVLPCITLFRSVKYHQEIEILNDVFLTFTDAGHILGSAVIYLRIKENNKWKHIVFTGDLGRFNTLMLPNPEGFKQADYIICESTYGDRLHVKNNSNPEDLLKIITHTCIEKKGKLIIPAFSLGRTQEILYTLDHLYNEGVMPNVPVYIDSPLSINITNISSNNTDFFNNSFQEYLKKDIDPFKFPNVKFINKATDSIALNALKEPCIIISASGMAEAGRIKHHIRNNITNKNNTILFSGYCEPSTLGGRILAGAKQVSIFGTIYPIYAEIQRLTALSAHADYEDMIQILACQNKELIKKIFLVHGDYDAQQHFKINLMNAGFHHIEIPNKGESFSGL